MRSWQLGPGGPSSSSIGLGANAFGRFCDAAQTKAVVDAALDMGINHIDTSETYGAGLSEEYLGKALKGRRDGVILATKTGMIVGEERGLGRQRVTAALERSLTRLGTDHVDLYYLHRTDPDTPLDETIGTLDDLTSQGKIRSYGICNHDASELAAVLLCAERGRYRTPVALQSHYNMLVRCQEHEVLAACKHFGLGFIAHTPLAGGFLTGKYRRGQPIPEETRGAGDARFRSLWVRGEYYDAVEKYERFAAARGRSVSELAVAWLLAQPLVSSVIVGARTVDQLRGIIGAVDWVLSDEELEELAGPSSAHRVRVVMTDQGVVLTNRD